MGVDVLDSTSEVGESHEIRSRIESIGPVRAAELLAENRHNRTLRQPRVRDLAEAMRRGEWDLNGESLKISADGGLLDGQHRLAAVLEAQVTVEFVVVTGLPVEAQDTVDTGRRRRLADVLTIRGITSPHAVAAALNLLHRYEQGQRLDISRSGAPTPQQALELLERSPALFDSVRVGRRAARETGGAASVFSVMHFLFAKVDQHAADEFFEALSSGADLSATDPVFQLRRHLLRPRKDRRYSQQPHHLSALTIKAFNLWRTGRTVEVLTYRSRGSTPEPFPTIEIHPQSGGEDA